MSDKPVLLMIVERFPPDIGGVARSSFRTAVALTHLGWDVHVLAWTKSLSPGVLESSHPEQYPPFQEGSDSGSYADMNRLTLHRLGLFSNMDLSMQHTSNVLEWLHKSTGYAATWGHYVYPAGYMAVVFAETAGIPSTVSARGNDIDRLMFPPGDFARLMWTLQRTTTVSCVSKELAGKIEMLLGERIDPLVVSNVVDPEIFLPEGSGTQLALRESLGIGRDEHVLGFCGELRHKKGLPFILAALRESQRVGPTCLLVIGAVRPREQAQLATFAVEFPEIAKRIVVTGHLERQSEVARHFQLCDVVLQPSLWDGLPNAVLEAMACGKIVVASDAGGIPEAIVHGKTGFLIPKALLNNLGKAVQDVLCMPSAQRSSIETAARDHVLTHFNRQQEALQLSRLLKRLSGGEQGQAKSVS
ncbi:MAG: glycosyltransferase family 4 protein [Rubripirellula sp.]|nr:glycosyltransferase family 4 protein [Rubripirellula sp.]